MSFENGCNYQHGQSYFYFSYVTKIMYYKKILKGDYIIEQIMGFEGCQKQRIISLILNSPMLASWDEYNTIHYLIFTGKGEST